MSKSTPMTLEEVLETCVEKSRPDDLVRRDAVAKVIADVCQEYGAAFDVDPTEVFEAIEAERTYWAVNYYQRAKFPPLDSVMIFETVEDLQESVEDRGFRCPRCKGVSTNPQTCNSGAEMDPGEICDWKAYGLFGTLGDGISILVREEFPLVVKPVQIFKPVAFES